MKYQSLNQMEQAFIRELITRYRLSNEMLEPLAEAISFERKKEESHHRIPETGQWTKHKS